MSDKQTTSDSIDRAKVMLEKLQQNFIEELVDSLDELEQLILNIESNDAIDLDEGIQNLYRHVHSLKGRGGIFGYPVITRICHQLEDNLTQYYDDSGLSVAELVDQSLQYHDLLRSAYALIINKASTFKEIEDALLSKQQAKNVGRFRCLVVDDSNTYRMLYKQTLQPFNVEAVFLEDGYEALGRLLYEKFDLVISSYEIGCLNGVTLINALRKSKSANKEIPCILITSSTAAVDGLDILDVNYRLNKGSQLMSELSTIIVSRFNKVQ